MKKNNRKGFTIVELVIVIAVIAILAAVLIPTFSGVISKANESAVQQKATALFKEAYALDLADGTLNGQEGTTPINKVADEDVTYSASMGTDGTATINFSYTDNTKQLTATFKNNTWTVTEPSDDDDAG